MRVNGLMAVGLLLIAVALFVPGIFATLVTDNTPPIISETMPTNAAVYPPNTPVTSNLYVFAYDTESGIKNITFTVDGTAYSLAYYMISGSKEIWKNEHQFSTVPGSHSYSVTVYNKADLSTLQAGNFQVYESLTGTWYINDQAILSSAQTVYSSNMTVSFKFVKNAGVTDQQITCKINEGTATIVTLSLTSTSTWTGIHTFSGGVHVLTLTAYDGRQTVTMGLVNLDFGGSTFALNLNSVQISLLLAGSALFGFGYLKQKKEG